MRKFPIISALAMITAFPATADVVAPGGRVIDCYCTDSQGARVELGQEICLFVDGRAFMALCDMSLNVPIWRDTGRACLSSHLSPRPLSGQIEQLLHPPRHALRVDPKI